MNKVTDMVVKSNESKVWGRNSRKGVAAKPAVAAVKGSKAVMDGDEVVKEAVKAVKAQPAVEAIPAVLRISVLGKTVEILDEVIARMSAKGWILGDSEAPVVQEDYGYIVDYYIDPIKQPEFRMAFKQCKTIDNEPGMVKLKKAADEKKAAEKAAAAKAKETEKTEGGSEE